MVNTLKTESMDFAKKNDFVVSNASEKYFDKDKELFIKTLPTSRLIPSLHKANQFNKRELDARMLMELLKFKTFDEVLKNRGIEVKKIEAPKTLTKESVDEKLKLLKDLSEVKYEDAKLFVSILGIQTINKKKETIMGALQQYHAALITVVDDEPAKTGVEDDKKKEGQE